MSETKNSPPRDYNIQNRLKKILESDPKSGFEKILLVLCRSALRCLPLIAHHGYFSVGGKDTEQQIINLLSVWRVCVFSYPPDATSEVLFKYPDYYSLADVLSKIYTDSFRYGPQNVEDNLYEGISILFGIRCQKYKQKSFSNFSKGIGIPNQFSSALGFFVHPAAKYDHDRAKWSAMRRLTDLADSVISRDISVVENNENWIHLQTMPLWQNSEPFGDKEVWDKLLSNWNKAFDLLMDSEFVKTHWQANKALEQLRIDYLTILFANKTVAEKLISITEHQQKPDIVSAKDTLNRGRLIDSLANRIVNEPESSHLTIGLFGKWGVGKSSFINHLKERLNQSEHVTYIHGEFNAWQYEHTENIQAGITQVVIEALTSDTPRSFKVHDEIIDQSHRYLCQKINKIKSVLIKVSDRVLLTLRFSLASYLLRLTFILMICVLLSILFFNPSFDVEVLNKVDLPQKIPDDFKDFLNNTGFGIGIAGGLYALWVIGTQIKTIFSQPLANELKTYLNLPQYGKYLGLLPVMAKHIKTMCRIRLGNKSLFFQQNTKQKRLLFVIDDLDRCGSDGIVKIIEAVRLILDVPNVTVIIAADQDIVLSAIASKNTDSLFKAKNYLNKVINLPVSLSYPDDQGVAEYLAELWSDENFVTRINGIKSKENYTQTKAEEQEYFNSVNPHQRRYYKDTHPEKQDKPLKLDDILTNLSLIDLQKIYHDSDKEEVNKQENEGLTEAQKQAFYSWLIKFDLRNPRQIKRLYNSYNLLQKVYIETKPDTEQVSLHVPCIIALLSLELIHSHLFEQEEINEKIKGFLFGRDSQIERGGFEKFESSFIEAKSAIKDAGVVNLDKAVEPFVLTVSDRNYF